MTDYIRITPEGHIRTTSSALYDYIVSYVPFSTINKMVGDPIALPNTVTVTRKSGLVETLIVKWEPVSTEVAGTFNISGGVDNSVYVVTQTVVVGELTDLDILRQIRDANPTSQLPALWPDSEDPYTQWEGVTWNDKSIDGLFLDNTGVTSVDLVSKLISLTGLGLRYCSIGSISLSTLTNLTQLYLVNNGISDIDVSANINLDTFHCIGNSITSLDLSTNKNLFYIQCQSNMLNQIILPYFIDENDPNILYNSFAWLYLYNNNLTSINTLYDSCATYDFTYNNFPTVELDRFRAMGFTDETKLLPQNP